MANSKDKTEAKKTDLVKGTDTPAPRAIHLALDVAERGQATAVAVLQDARIELRTAVDGTIDLAEKLAAGTVRFARKLVQKLDETASDALAGSERALHDTIESARETARAGRVLAEKTLDRVTGASAA